MRRVFACLIVLVLGACAGVYEPSPRLQTQMKEVQLRLFVLVEEKRHRLDERAKPLVLDPQLVAAAQLHAQAMAQSHAMDTTTPERNPALKALMADPQFQGFVGENIAQQYFNDRQSLDVEKFAQEYLDIWLQSADHKQNLSFYGYNRTGIGIATDGKAVFVSELFATDLGLKPPPDVPAAAVTSTAITAPPVSISPESLGECATLVLARLQSEHARLNPGASALTADADLGRIARERSIDMATRGAYEHTNAAGENPYQIVTREISGFHGAVGENIMTDTVAPGTTFDASAAATRIVGAWMASAPHAANIGSPRFDKVGVGIAQKNGTVYITVLFTGPAGDATP